MAEQLGRAGHPDRAADCYRTLIDEAGAVLPPGDPTVLALRHQLAHWTGESGEPRAAVEMFAALLADREEHQGPRHADTELARHQLAHWHGRAGNTAEAVRRYQEMHAAAERAGRTETALDLLCNVGHWQQEGGDTASALRTFTAMLDTAERELGPAHQCAAIARQRYAVLAGDLPFGHDRGHDSLQDLRAAAQEVERVGDMRRAARMHGRIAERSEHLYGMASSQALNAWVARAQATVAADDPGEAAEAFRRVLDCMELRGDGPGTPEYDTLNGQREVLARAGRRPRVRLAPAAASALAAEAEAAPGTAFGVLLRTPGARVADRLWVLRDRAGGTGPAAVDAPLWSALREELSGRGQEPVAFYAARPGRRPAPDDARLGDLTALPVVFVSAGDDGTVEAEGHLLGGGEPAAVRVVVEAEDERAAEPAAPARDAEPGARMPFNAGAVAIGTWREVRRALPSRAAGEPEAFGPYRVLELVGEGGFGRIHLCQDDDGILVAVKTLHEQYAADPGVREDFAHEVRAARRVAGRFTVPVVAADTEAATPWMAVPYVAAPSLGQLLARTGGLDEAGVRAIGAGIATALTAIHAQGIVHLDLKPANVLMTEDGPRVIDFGIAQIERLTAPREGFAGTYLYASPEQLREEEHFTPASDVFSLGTLLAVLALGRSPWGGGETMPVIVRICSGEPDLTGLPAGLEDVVRRCLRLDPAERPTPAEVARALLPGTPDGPVAPPPLPRPARDLIREHATRTVPAGAGPSDATVADVRDAVPPADGPAFRPVSATAREATRALARDLGVRVARWEKAPADADPARTGRECAAFVDEARTVLGERHALTLRLRLSYALLGAEPADAGALDRLVRDAAATLGEHHPTVVDARTLLIRQSSAP
ncbi:protein kinase [Streptomyces sp. HPF1205]|uniref:protein kinase domain-containing protein n=1 Tax=Streptomyces sp. HPF1205 TaxID=2873262 RepID=UPI001CEC6F58|nr:protein kinase [Streptomyces sp. HPF1205]